ncbi:glycosyltransferase family 2 protein [Vibrio chagasii]|uniref:glycosyltransferase family 2 protein n=1 Tax=Vibrio chagasii TaxID=170679 RepID=UPI0038CD52ED
MSKVDIVIASYNGELYIKKQIESIFSNTLFNECVNKVIISDDNSSDNTVSIVEGFSDERLILVENHGGKGVINNFQNALCLTESKYVILSDQDDLWTKDKIEVLLNGIKSTESNDMPCLFFSDLIVIDEIGNIICDSFWEYQGLDPNLIHNKADLIFQNVSPGCAMIVNRELLNLSLPFPKEIAMHDWWLLLVANTFGKVGFTYSATTLYRQHTSNVVGATGSTVIEKLNKIKNLATTGDKGVRYTQLLALKNISESKSLPMEPVLIRILGLFKSDFFHKARSIFRIRIKTKFKLWLLFNR